MGVKGLWTVLEPACERLQSQDRLRNHRIAIDASIWMYQLSKALPTSETNTQTGAGYNPLVLAGLVKRVCKLLHFGIKPIFVFDGGVPILKQSTIKDRKSKRAEAESRYKRLAKKMLKIRMSLAAIGASEEPKTILKDIVPGIIEEVEEEWSESSESEYGDLDYEQLDALDIDSSDFKALPLDLKQELLMALKERTFAKQLGKTAQLMGRHEDALDFSRNQIEALMKRRKIAGELERVSKTGFGSVSGADGPGHEKAFSHRIASSSTREFVLVKNDTTGGWVFSDTGKQKEEVVKKEDADFEDDSFERDFFADDDFEPPKPSTVVQVPRTPSEAPVISIVAADEDVEITSSSTALEKYIQEELTAYLPEFDTDEEEVLPAFENLIASNKPSVSEEYQEVSEEAELEEEQPVVPLESEELEELGELEEPEGRKNDPQEAYLHQDDEDNFLEEYRYATREELLERLGVSLTEARQGREAAQNESAMLGNELLSDFQQLLSHFGLPWIIAPMEAEAQCAWLQHTGLVDGIITDDSDVFLFAPKETPLLVYRHFFKDKHHVRVYGLPRIGFQMDLNRGDLVVLAFLLGGDYGVGVRGIGAKRGLEILRILKRSETFRVQNKNSPEDESGYCSVILNLIRKLVADFDLVGADLSLEDQRALEKLLDQIHHLDDDFPSQAILKAYLEPAVSEDRRPFVWQLPNAASLENFLHTRLSWSQSHFRTIIGPLLRSNLGP